MQSQLLVPINVVTVGGNHDDIRPLNSKRQLEGENLSKLVVEFLKLRLKDFETINTLLHRGCPTKNVKQPLLF